MTILEKQERQLLRHAGIAISVVLLVYWLFTVQKSNTSGLPSTWAEQVVDWCDIQLFFL